MPANLADWLRLIAVTDDRWLGGRDVVGACASAARGGATSLQIRFKLRSPAELVALVRAVIAAVTVPVLVDDRVDVALAAGARGVHLGADDLPPNRVRALVPPGFVIGASVGDPSEVRRGAAADYWGIGPWRRSPTRADAGPALGPDGFAALVKLAGGRPCVAIGGVLAADGPAVRAAGGAGIAVVSGIFSAADPERAARAYRAGES